MCVIPLVSDFPMCKIVIDVKYFLIILKMSSFVFILPKSAWAEMKLKQGGEEKWR